MRMYYFLAPYTKGDVHGRRHALAAAHALASAAEQGGDCAIAEAVEEGSLNLICRFSDIERRLAAVHVLVLDLRGPQVPEECLKAMLIAVMAVNRGVRVLALTKGEDALPANRLQDTFQQAGKDLTVLRLAA